LHIVFKVVEDTELRLGGRATRIAGKGERLGSAALTGSTAIWGLIPLFQIEDNTVWFGHQTRGWGYENHTI